MSPASPTPPPRAHGRVCVHECGGTLSTTMATTTATHPYLLMKRMHFSQLIPQTTRRHCFCPKPIQAHAEEKHTQEMSPRKLNFQGIIYLLVTKKGKGLSSGPLSPYIRVLPETHFSASLAALNWGRLLKHISIFYFVWSKTELCPWRNPGSEHHIHQVYHFLLSSREGGRNGTEMQGELAFDSRDSIQWDAFTVPTWKFWPFSIWPHSHPPTQLNLLEFWIQWKPSPGE